MRRSCGATVEDAKREGICIIHLKRLEKIGKMKVTFCLLEKIFMLGPSSLKIWREEELADLATKNILMRLLIFSVNMSERNNDKKIPAKEESSESLPPEASSPSCCS